MSWATCWQASCCQESCGTESLRRAYGVDSRGQVSGQKRAGTSGTGTIFIGWDAAYAYEGLHIACLYTLPTSNSGRRTGATSLFVETNGKPLRVFSDEIA